MLLFGVLFDVAFTLVRRAAAGERITQAPRGHLYQVAHRAGMAAPLVAALHWLAEHVLAGRHVLAVARTIATHIEHILTKLVADTHNPTPAELVTDRDRILTRLLGLADHLVARALPLAHEPVATESKSKITAFAKQPVGFFKGRKPLWWAWWLVRAGGLVAVFIGFILLLRNFYEWRNTCSWCKHLSCLVRVSLYVTLEEYRLLTLP